MGILEQIAEGPNINPVAAYRQGLADLSQRQAATAELRQQSMANQLAVQQAQRQNDLMDLQRTKLKQEDIQRAGTWIEQQEDPPTAYTLALPTLQKSHPDVNWSETYNPAQFMAAKSPTEATNLQRNLQAAGLQPGTPEYQQAMMRAITKPATEVTIGKESDEEAKTVGKFFGEQFAETQKEAGQARTTIARMNRAKQLLANVETGALKPTTQSIKRLARGLGIDLEVLGITDDIPVADAMRSLGGELALASVQKTKGAVSEKEMELFAQIAPGLATSPAGNMLIIEMAQTLNQRLIDVAKLQRKYRQENGRLDEGWLDQLDEYHADNPLFTDDLSQRIENARREPQETREIGGKTYIKIDGVWFEQ